MALSYSSNRDSSPGSCDPRLALTDSLMGIISDPLEAPEFDIASLLNLKPITDQYAEPKPVQVLTINSSPLTTPCIHSLHQDLYNTNAQNSCHANAEFVPSPFLKYQQTCNDDFSTACLTNQVNFRNENTGLPVRPCTGTVQGMVVPAFKCTLEQSVAARVRRKKISEKTQELTKLIPGGTSMNTAEMLLASFKYIKFLQAQVGILAMMHLKEVVLLIFILLILLLSGPSVHKKNYNQSL